MSGKEVAPQQEQAQNPSRRRFMDTVLKATAGAAVLGAGVFSPQEASAGWLDYFSSGEPQNFADIFAGISLKDQYGKDIDPVVLAGNGPAIVLVGYGGCGMCEQISRTVAQLQKSTRDAGVHVPIFVISMQPEKDAYQAGEDNPMKKYMAGYYALGVKQYKGEKLADNPDISEAINDTGTLKRGAYARDNNSYAAAASIPQKDRILHIMTAPTDADAMTLQTRLGVAAKKTNPDAVVIFDPDENKTHTPYLVAVKGGKTVEAQSGVNPDGMAPPSYASDITKIMAKSMGISVPAKSLQGGGAIR